MDLRGGRGISSGISPRTRISFSSLLFGLTGGEQRQMRVVEASGFYDQETRSVDEGRAVEVITGP